MKITLREKTAIMIDNNQETIIEKNIDNIKPNSKNERYLILPKNSVNRKYTNLDKLIKLQTIDYGDEIKESRTINRTNLNHEPKTSLKWYDYLTDEERKTLETIKENATRRMNDPLEILLRQKRELERKIAELQSKDTK